MLIIIVLFVIKLSAIMLFNSRVGSSP